MKKHSKVIIASLLFAPMLFSCDIGNDPFGSDSIDSTNSDLVTSIPEISSDSTDSSISKDPNVIDSLEKAYQYAIEHYGYKGSFEEFCQSVKGDKGDKGESGEDGLSAYEIYKKYHPEYTGTEEDWMNEFFGNLDQGCKHENAKPIDKYSFDIVRDGEKVYKVTKSYCEECSNYVDVKEFLGVNKIVVRYYFMDRLVGYDLLDYEGRDYIARNDILVPDEVLEFDGKKYTFTGWDYEEKYVNSDISINALYKPQYTGALGNAGYYFAGDTSQWGDFWKYDNFEKFEFTKINEDKYQLYISITDEMINKYGAMYGDTSINFKVVYWSGNDDKIKWYPDGLTKGSSLTSSGEYLITFNPNATDTYIDEHGETQKQYITFERVGLPKKVTAFESGEMRTDANIGLDYLTIKVNLEEGLTLPENTTIYAYFWDLKTSLDSSNNYYFELAPQADGTWAYTTDFKVIVGFNNSEGINHDFCLIVDQKGQTEQNWDGKVSNYKNSNGNYSSKVNCKNPIASATIKKADKPYWTIGETFNPCNLRQLHDLVISNKIMNGQEVTFEGEIESYTYDELNDTYTIVFSTDSLANATNFTYKITGAKLLEGINSLYVKRFITVTGKINIDTSNPNNTIVSMENDSNNHPIILKEQLGKHQRLYVRGTMNAWDALDEYELQPTSNPNVFELSIDLQEGDEFKLGNKNWTTVIDYDTIAIDPSVSSCFGPFGSSIKTLVTGRYVITYDIGTNTPTVTIRK